MPVTPRHLGRYRQIVEVLISHGFGAAIAQLGLERRLNLPIWLLRRKEPATTELSPAEHVRLALEELGATFVKLGQILSTRPDLLPPAYIVELSRLQDRVPPAPWEKIKARIEEELGEPVERLFTSIDPASIAAASLAQVHAATLPDGRTVVVKVQRPKIEQIINLDLDILYDLSRLAEERTPFGHDLVEIVEDFSVFLRAELDYRREGRNADRFRINFAKEPQLYIPQIHWDYTTNRVLVQERIDGIKIDDIAAIDAAGYNREKLALYSARLVIKEVLEDGFFHADPHPGNVLVLPGEVIGLVDFGTMGYLETSDRAHLIRLYITAVQMDVDGFIDQLVRMGVAQARAERTALRRDIRRLLIKYNGMPLKEVAIRELLEDVRPIIYSHNLRIPTDLWLLAKTLVMMEGVGKRLAPEFDIFEVSRPYVRTFVRRLWLPTEWGPEAMRHISSWGDLLSDLPGRTNRVLTQVERGEISLNLHITEVQQTVKRLDDIANRVILSLLLAAFIVALALLIPTLNLTWPWGLLTWIIIVGFVVMSVLALWLMWSIFRSGGSLGDES
ncbi:MAG TPA: AarF/ABC1/UbiB kinase family protein [Anaerolineae bacterium]|nr:AarF/ABC1/UbiB kinase family protein [Anaerolineae bacterium]